jgi:hypothetical protein
VEPAVEEFTIPLDRRAQVTSSHGSFSALIHDHGVETFSVSINGERTRRLEKIKGFESTATNLAFIHTLSGARVYYVDRISVASNCCVLKVVPDHRPIARQ